MMAAVHFCSEVDGAFDRVVELFLEELAKDVVPATGSPQLLFGVPLEGNDSEVGAVEDEQLALAVLVHDELTDVFYFNYKFACKHVDQVNITREVLFL